MKRLFRTSKPEVNPLPPPLPPGPQQNGILPPGPPVQQKRSVGTGAPVGGAGGHHHHSHSEHKPRQGSVTPFPMDIGRETPSPQHPQPQPTNQPPHQPQQTHQQPPPSSQTSSLGRSKGKEKVLSSAPSLLEIQRMQEAHDAEKENRRDEWLASQRSPPRPTSMTEHSQPIAPPSRRIYESASSPEGWSVVSGPPAIPTQTPSNASTPTVQQTQLYLPPGARPPSPASQLRPGTPTRPSYPSSLGHSQSSITTNGNPTYAGNPETETFTPRAGRDRGYSSASGSMRGSDHEGSAHGHGYTTTATTKMPVPKPSPAMATRSPLSNSYQSPNPPIQSPYPPQSFPAQPTPYSSIVEEMSNVRVEGPTPDVETPRAEVSGKDKEKKKFWGMAWGGERKDKLTKSREIDVRPSMDEPRRSGEWKDELQQSSTGHGTEEDYAPRGRMLGLDFGGGRHQKEKEINPSQVDNVTSAIQILCAAPDPAFSATYEVCDRINHSSSPESVGKEAAQALRKQFKHGNENERRAAANLWLIMMRNVTAKGFRAHATGKKFVAGLEPILLAPPGRALVTPQTHRKIAEILSDLTFHFGQDKGSESLGELWRKIKLPQEPEGGMPLPADFQAFTPDNFYAPRVLGSFDSGMIDSPPSSVSLSASRRPSSPNLNHLGVDNRSVPPPVPNRGPSPLHMNGPGYAALPSHGDDIRRLVEECLAAKESARVLTEALVYTRPQELDSKPIIKEFYRKCFLAHGSLTNQIDWAQAEANQSRERASFEAAINNLPEVHGSTDEEIALATLFESHSMLAEALKQHDDMERLARDEQELREVRERSKKETRMDRNQQLLDPQGDLAAQMGSSSRTPSPAPHAHLPLPPDTLISSPRQHTGSLPVPMPRPYSSDTARSRTPSPDRYPLPKIPPSPGRAASPLGQSVLSAKPMRGPRPLPNPFMRGQNPSQQSLTSSTPREPGTNPSRSGTGSTGDMPHDGAQEGSEEESIPHKPSRKALGKRRAVEDPDNHFDPDDMFGLSKKSTDESSEESVLADEVYLSKPVKYAYDAYQEKIDRELAASAEESRNGGASSGGGGSGGGSGGSGGGSSQRLSLGTAISAA